VTLIDTAAFFSGVRHAALQARHSILIMGSTVGPGLWAKVANLRIVFPQNSARFLARSFDGGLGSF